MESCRPAIIVSFGVTAHWSLTAPSVSEGKFGDSEAGIDSRQSFVVSVHDSKHLARPPVKGGLGGGDFHFSDTPATAEVCPVGQVPDLPRNGFV